MKKTYNINISGYLFVIDCDAYDLLDDYLKTLQHAFVPLEDGADLIADMELRIAEILSELTYDGKSIVELRYVETVIARMGNPEDMIEEATNKSDTSKVDGPAKEKTEKEKITPPPYIPRPRKKLYRDMQDKMVGGVCSGFAAYLGIDVTIVRLLFVIFSIMSFSTFCAIYIVLWIVVPEAVTPLQQMQMRGEETTMENIGKTVTDFFKSNSSDNNVAMTNQTNQSVNSFVGILLKCIFMFIIVIMSLILFAITMAALACLFIPIHDAFASFFTIFGFEIPLWIIDANDTYLWPGMIFIAGFLITLIIPLFMLVRFMVRSFSSPKNRRPMGKGQRNALLIIWITGIVAAMITFGMLYDKKERINGNTHLFDHIEIRGKNINEIDSIADHMESYCEKIDFIL